MKKLSLNILTAAGLSLGLLAFTAVREGGIKGRVLPAEAGTQVLAVSGVDTLRAEINSGNFTFTNVKKGTYTIWIKAKAPFKDTSLENVAVIDSALTDVGEIKLAQ